MVRISSLLGLSALPLLACLPSASAWIDSISAPTTPIAPGANFQVTFETSDYIQNNAQYYTLFGIKESSLPFAQDQTALGLLLGTGKDLVTSGHSITGDGSYKVTVQLPSTVAANTNYTLAVAVLSTVSFCS
jgi:hypothetical protein